TRREETSDQTTSPFSSLAKAPPNFSGIGAVSWPFFALLKESADSPSKPRDTMLVADVQKLVRRIVQVSEQFAFPVSHSEILNARQRIDLKRDEHGRRLLDGNEPGSPIDFRRHY